MAPITHRKFTFCRSVNAFSKPGMSLRNRTTKTAKPIRCSARLVRWPRAARSACRLRRRRCLPSGAAAAALPVPPAIGPASRTGGSHASDAASCSVVALPGRANRGGPTRFREFASRRRARVRSTRDRPRARPVRRRSSTRLPGGVTMPDRDHAASSPPPDAGTQPMTRHELDLMEVRYGNRFLLEDAPDHQLPETGMPALDAMRLAGEELVLDGMPRRNLGTVGTTGMEPEAPRRIAE